MLSETSKKHLPWLSLALGLVGWGLRQGLYALAVDSRGLLIPRHPLALALWCLTALTLGGLGFLAWKYPTEAGGAAPPSLAAGAGRILAGTGFLLTALLAAPQMEDAGRLWQLLGILSFPCLVAAGFCRARGRQPFFLLHLIPCLFLVLHIIGHYRGWSSDPQLMDYAFSLFAVLSLMLYAFYHTSADADLPHPRLLLALGLGAIYLNAVSLTLDSSAFLSLGAIAWASTDTIPAIRKAVDL